MRPSGPTDSDQQVSDSGFCVKGYHFTAYGAVCAAAADAAIPTETVLIKSRRCNLALLMIAPPFTYRCRVDPAGKRDQLQDLSKVKSWLFTTLHRAFLESRRRFAR